MIDFRSDTVTRPTPGMRKAMAAADVGDDVYGDDPCVNALQERVADLLGHQAALLVPSGTQSNLTALLTHCARGDEYLVGQAYHTYLYEAGGASALGGIVAQPIELKSDGTIPLEKILGLIKPDDSHFAKTRLICLENTHSGKVIPNSYLNQVIQVARDKELGIHLDGARVFNAAVAQDIDIKTITRDFDSVSICFSKGLGTPIGSVLCGSKAFIEQARRWRKMLGGGMRQAGVIAAAMDYALDNHVSRLAQDHQHTRQLATLLKDIDELEVNHPETNMLYLTFANDSEAHELESYLKENNILISAGKTTRLVTHLDITEEDILTMAKIIKQFFSNRS